MFRNNLVAFILTLACFVVLIPNLGSAQAEKVKNSMAALKAETGKLGAPAVQSNELHFGKSKVSAEHTNSPAIAKLNNGEPYYGDVKVFSKTYDAGYEPIKDASGAIIGAYFVGYPK